MAITIEKIKIYRKYRGDIDAWARAGKKTEHQLMHDNDWALIEELVQSLKLVKKGLTSTGFALQTLNKVKEFCPREEDREALWDLLNY